VFEEIWPVLEQQWQLKGFRWFAGSLLLAMDGTQYFGSSQIHCPHCSTRQLKSGKTSVYEHLEGIDLPMVTTKRWTGKVEETYTYRYLNGVPLRDEDDVLLVNWCEITVSRPDGKVTYKNSFATSHAITDDTVAAVILAGRTRWKVENENNNPLKTKGHNPLNVFRQLGSTVGIICSPSCFKVWS
jgi:hypothetical protein